LNLPILIVGQGISGTMLSWMLKKNGIAHLVLDNDAPNSASRVAAGIINPVTGRRIVKTWMIDDLIPFAVATYKELEKELQQKFIAYKPIVDYFPTLQMKEAFEERLSEKADYLVLGDSIKIEHQLLNNFGYGIIQPAYVTNVNLLIHLYSNYLKQSNALITDEFNEEELVDFGTHVTYCKKPFRKVIYATGYTCQQSKYWSVLPFAPNKGEAIIIKAPALLQEYIYKRGITIAPINNQHFWVGANYAWNFADECPTPFFCKQTEKQLQEILRIPFTVVNHLSAIRPANIERRPFVGFHPLYKNIGILNGMGAKGTSLAPYFAQQLADHIAHNTPLLPEVDVLRFENILIRG
jgi:glycine/D-amino acid oxidase-like deaminating enzyme